MDVFPPTLTNDLPCAKLKEIVEKLKDTIKKDDVNYN